MTGFDKNIDMKKFINFTGQLVKPESLSCGVDKNSLRLLCELATSKKDRHLIRVAATSRMSERAAHAQLGISDLNKEREKVTVETNKFANWQRKLSAVNP